MPKLNNITGKVFGRLTAISAHGRNKDGGYKWLCLCECGAETVVRSSYKLTSGNTRSCGCLQKELNGRRASVHGEASNGHVSPEYDALRGMKSRCYNKNNSAYMRYGGRGITVCDRWLNSIEWFIDDMGRKPSTSHSIDRRDNNGNYEPNNCRWATPGEQMRNTRRTRMITFNGETKCMKDWADDIGINITTLSSRLDKYSLHTALTTPKGAIRNV